MTAKKILKNQKGFTLIELIMVIVILSLLGVVAIPFYVDLRQDARNANEVAVAGGVQAGITTYFIDPARGNRTSYPTSAQIDPGAAAAVCSQAQPCFEGVLAQGGIMSDWTKLSATTWRSPVNTTNVWTYDPVTGSFTKTVA